MENATQEEKNAFLEELTLLSRKHGIVVAGCGCCGSPSLDKYDTTTGSYADCSQSYIDVEWK